MMEGTLLCFCSHWVLLVDQIREVQGHDGADERTRMHKSDLTVREKASVEFYTTVRQDWNDLKPYDYFF